MKKNIIQSAKRIIKSTLHRSAGLPLIKKFLSRWQGSFAIFCLHRVLPDEQALIDTSPTSNLVLSSTGFSEILKFLNQNYRVVSIDELIHHLQSGSKEFVVCITLDDGYKDNLTHALPILESYETPATIYVTTRFPEGESWIWWYELWEHLLEIEWLSVKYGDTQREYECKNLSQKHICYLDLHDWMMTLTLKRQKYFLEDLTGTLKRRSYSNICLDWDEIQNLDRHPLITIGAHTHSHPILSNEDEESAHIEIKKSKILLEMYLKHSIHHFAYPYGNLLEAGEREYKLTKGLGFRTAVTTRNYKSSNQLYLQLPRYGISENSTPFNLKSRIGGLSNAFGKQFS